MLQKTHSHLVIFLTIFTLTSFAVQESKTIIYLIGDSTIATKEVKAYPETGWGMPFQYFFDSTVVIENHAKNGRSTRTFISENRWSPIETKLKKGDYVFMQFGHNDESKEKTDRYTTPEEYKRNLTKFISEARGKGATPVLLTPVSRRKFVEGKQQETHALYSTLVKEVALSEKVAFIDLDALSREYYQNMGEENSKLLFLQLEAGEHPNYPEGKIDNTHFSEMGARKIAQIVLTEIKRLDLPLAKYIYKPVPKK
ncbi:GntR family transcriptional regulator [Chryseotalea sanaruensis]|uniref:GntR family transcriptional regulator n=1 Tax=Chryseotalea sanaruensis TaxID=2482724 RepID=A0A401U5C8_9BACT|nr:rhamnogalacturonan acetylesterase [Chryseotalea sanaruensis]GCC50075.1 GntR family transcriptional regulator [Chryseotalea sanaruensis]